ncbi:MAG: hypothetical protein JO227_12365 [Acetobacteraceae bacterium]|nr:hypothetical protein [Acetobacteraceae bacterium]
MKNASLMNDDYGRAGRLRTRAVSAEHAREPLEVLELALEDLDRVAGGARPKIGHTFIRG